MHLIPTQDEVVAVLRETGALRDGHFEYPTGMHSNEYLQVPLALRYSQYQRMLSVGLSRLLRAHPEIRAAVKDLSIVTPMTGGLPVAYGVCEALRAKQVYWAERERRRAAALPPVSGAAPGRASGAGGRHPAHRQQARGTEAAPGIARRHGGRPGRDHLPADSHTMNFGIASVVLSGQTGRQLLCRRGAVRDVPARRAGREGLGLDSIARSKPV